MFAEIVKVGAKTPSVSVVVSVSAPEVPVMVAVDVPIAAVELAVSVRVLLWVTGFRLHDAVTPAGRPETARFTLPANPYSAFTKMFDVPLLPWPMVTLLAESVKVGVNTPSVRVVVAVVAPDFPVMVNV